MLKLTAFILLFPINFFFVIATIGWLNGESVAPIWLILVCLPSFSYLTYRLGKSLSEEPDLSARNAKSQDTSEPTKIWTDEEIESYIAEKKRVEQLDFESHEYILALCKAKNIQIRQTQTRNYSGHADAPEVWEIEKLIPLNDLELKRLETFDNLDKTININEKGEVFCIGFSRKSDWVIYEIAKKADSL